MKLKLDENLPQSAAGRLAALGFDVDSVRDEGLTGASDPDVWSECQRVGRFFVTQDLDFSDARAFAPQSHRGILLVRVPDSEQWRVADYLVAWFGSPDVDTWSGCFIVATPNKVRVMRQPPPPA